MQNTLRFPLLPDSTYRIESQIGAGGGGVVYKGWHTRLQKHVVIKELKSGSSADIETQRNEAEALKNVKSEYLPQVFDFLTVDNRVYTVMEFVDGESLDKHLNRGERFSQTQVIRWYGQLASALEAIHKHNICHRDIKPANIMLTPEGDVCLIDFNAALVSGNDVNMISRSLGYASPEQYEIYEKYKNLRESPIQYANSSSAVAVDSQTHTHLLEDDATFVLDEDRTVLLTEDDSTERLSQILQADDRTHALENERTARMGGDVTPGYSAKGAEAGRAGAAARYDTSHIDWKRSDIYSLGATMYHLLTGIHPPEKAAQTKLLGKVGRFSEGVLYIVEQSMQISPDERFQSVSHLSDAIRNIHKHDARWRAARAKRIAAGIILPVAFAAFAATAYAGQNVMAQEREERFYDAVYRIETSEDPQAAYQAAFAEYENRIDPYRAMAERLWAEGDLDACRAYIEENLGSIAEFQNDRASQRSFGDIYYILGNCGYYQSGQPDYNMAKGNFEIAVQFVTDNPIYYRDYAVSLARTGEIAQAEHILDIAKQLNLDTDSVNLLSGEIAFAKGEYESALKSFITVTSSSSDEYLRYRAYHTSDEIYDALGQPENSVAMLTEALYKIPLNRVPEMKEQLADAYVRSGDYDSAIVLFTELAEAGVPQFHILQDLAILLHTMGDYQQAEGILLQMKDLFPADYRVPMRLAYLEADWQSTYENEDRDYLRAKQYYDEAAALYNDQLQPGDADPEMQQLELIMQQLRDNDWID